MTGQLSRWNDERRFIGKLDREHNIEPGQQAARLCGLNQIAHLRVALAGDLDRLMRCIRIAGVSDLFVEEFGESGRHTRMTVCATALP